MTAWASGRQPIPRGHSLGPRLRPLRKAQAALDAAAHTPDEDFYDRLGARHDRAMRRLIRTPAPDLPALAAKLELALDERSGEFFGDSDDMKAIKSDARRLASPAKSVTGDQRS